jgi:hypothetical protein
LTRLLTVLTIVFLFASCSSKGQKYRIDQNISKSIDSTFKENVLFDSPIKSEFSFHVANTFDYEKFEQNGMDLSYFLKGDSYESSDQYVNSMTQCYLSKDTIVLVGGLFYESGVGFRITIFGDKFNTQLFLTATDKIYSKTNNKKDLEKEIIQDADSLSMTLTQKPTFKIGSTIKGKLKLKSKPIYQLDKGNALFKIDPKFDIIFDIKINEKETE